MKVALCSDKVGSCGNNGGLAATLLPHLRAAGVEVVHLTELPTEPVEADWWLVLDYITHLEDWLKANQGRAKVAYTEGIPARVDLSLPWRQDRPNPLTPFCFLPEKLRGGETSKSGIIVDHAWPGFRERGLDQTPEILEALGSFPGPKVALTHHIVPTPAAEGWVVRPRIPRDEFIALLARSTGLIQTHLESYGAAIREALFLGCRVYVHPPFVEPALLGLKGVVPFDDPQELPALLAEERGPFTSELVSIEAMALEVVTRLRETT